MIIMECQRLDDWMPPFIEGVLPQDERNQVAAHLEACGSCRTEADLYRRTVAVLDRVKDPPLPDSFFARQARMVMARLRPAPLWQAPPHYLTGFLVVAVSYVAVGLDGVGRLLGDMIESGGGITADTLTLVPLYALLVAMAFVTVQESRSPEPVLVTRAGRSRAPTSVP